MKPTADPSLPGPARGRGHRAAPGGLAALALVALLVPAAARAADTDGDGWDDALDTCSALAHHHLGDADGDGFGDPCDCDFDGDGACNVDDFSIFVPDLMAGIDGGSGTDMNGDGSVNINDFGLFVPGFLAGAPGPGSVGAPDPAAFPGVTCEGPLASDVCFIQLAPAIALEVLRSQLTLEVGDLAVSGDVRVPAPQGQIWLLEGDLVVVAGDGPFGFETVRGSAVLRNELPDFLEDVDVTGLVVEVGLDLGANIEADVPLQADLHYLFFLAQAGLVVDAGPFMIEGPGAGMTLLFNPSDPFLYAGASVANIPIPTPAGPFILSAGGGLGFSRQGLTPFEPAVTGGIAALFPSFDGHIVHQASGELPSCVGCPTLTFAGYAITDLDPEENGLALFGPAETGGDVGLGINGDFGVEGNLGLLSLSVDLFDATGGLLATSDELSVFAGGRIGSQPDLFALDVATAFELFPPAAGELGLGVLISSNPANSFFRFEGQGIVVDAPGVVAATGVQVAQFAAADFFFQTGGSGTFLGGSTTAQQIVEGVRALEASSWDLSFPSEAPPELVLYSRFEIGEHQLRESTMWISPVRIAQLGLLDMPSYTFTMYGEITRDGPLHRGTLEVPIPYHYPAVEAALQLADLISQQEAEVAQIEQQAGQAAAAVSHAQQALAQAQAALNVAQDAFDSAEDALDDNLDSIDYWESYDCGCGDCAWYDAPCWTACGICEGSVFLTIEGLEKLTDGLRLALNIARTGLLAAQGEVGDAQSALTLAQGTLGAIHLSLGSALAELSSLYAQRDALPAEDGVFDAIVELTLTAEDLVGSVGGDFQGVPVGTGVVYMDGTPRACFRPPVPGATEEFCTPL